MIPPNLRQPGRRGSRTLKRSEAVALELVQDIVEGGLKPGDPLRMESELLAHYGVSRPSLREAMRLLEFQGLIQVRPGPGAGTVVGRADPEPLARTIVLYLHLLGVSYADILECWGDTQGWLAEAAASNPDKERVERLMSPFTRRPEDLTEDEKTQTVGSVFHRNIYELAGNDFRTLLIRAVDTVALDHVLPAAPRLVPDNMILDHSLIAKAVIAGDRAEAGRLSREHIAHIVDKFREHWPDRVGDGKLEWHMFK